MSTGPEQYFIFSVAGFFGGIVLFGYGLILLKRKRLIENTPTSKVRSLAMGPVEVYGAVVPDKVFKSQFQNADCVYYKYRIEEYRHSGKSSHWVTIRSGSDGTPFYIKDNTGSVLVDPAQAKISVSNHYEFNSNMGKDPPKQIISFLKNSDLNFEGFFGINKRMRFTEYLIEPKENLYIFGTADDNPYVKDGTAKQGVEDIMIQKGKNFFYISDKPEKDILRSLTWQMIGGLFGGAVLTVICMIVLLQFFGLM
jgi:hypothetical protein